MKVLFFMVLVAALGLLGYLLLGQPSPPPHNPTSGGVLAPPVSSTANSILFYFAIGLGVISLFIVWVGYRLLFERNAAGDLHPQYVSGLKLILVGVGGAVCAGLLWWLPQKAYGGLLDPTIPLWVKVSVITAYLFLAFCIFRVVREQPSKLTLWMGYMIITILILAAATVGLIGVNATEYLVAKELGHIRGILIPRVVDPNTSVFDLFTLPNIALALLLVTVVRLLFRMQNNGLWVGIVAVGLLGLWLMSQASESSAGTNKNLNLPSVTDVSEGVGVVTDGVGKILFGDCTKDARMIAPGETAQFERRGRCNRFQMVRGAKDPMDLHVWGVNPDRTTLWQPGKNFPQLPGRPTVVSITNTGTKPAYVAALYGS